MNHDYADLSFTQREWYPDAYHFGSGTGRPGSPSDGLHAGAPLEPPDTGWDPAEELAYLLQDAMPAERATVVPPPRSEPPSGVDFTDPLENLAQITAQLPPIRRSSAGHRKIQVDKLRFKWLQTGSFVIVAIVAVIVAMVSVFGAMAAYAPLQHITSGAKGGKIAWWPLLVYGPWIVASLSILRTALHRRRALHSWFVVLIFSSVAIMLCVAQAERTFAGIAGAALPAIASLACFQQLVRQITLTLPPRKSASRHRH
ncbi:DUF2637 domain-containing protein [Streptomyces sp. NBC_01235]|uniref:DUF2637 domain-containing protein n=1 Tax=Streptomyces sp. NBC_01235 TaxID=2903788 RepID=UPI002E0E4A30|nr:DUF2637 domain-containing protein [Streptomyces sp. NBC_01235]